jgi:predicted Zn-dependent peptidase
LDKSFIDNFEKNVDGLDLTKTNQIISKYFPKDKLQFVLIGKSEDIKKTAEKYGKVTEVEINDDIKKMN